MNTEKRLDENLRTLAYHTRVWNIKVEKLSNNIFHIKMKTGNRWEPKDYEVQGTYFEILRTLDKDFKVSLNYRQDTIDSIINESYDSDWYGGLRSFQGISLDQLQELIKSGYCDPTSKQNDAPNIGTMVDFFNSHDADVWFGGYVISEERDDSRISIDAFECNQTKRTKAFLQAFMPNKLDERGKRYEAWWD